MLCRVLIAIFAICYLAALALLAVGTFGLFGAEQDPLSGIFLLPLGLPWNLVPLDGPDHALRAIGLGAPLINLVLLVVLCRALRRRSPR